jgi:prevent-host-death family protein
MKKWQLQEAKQKFSSVVDEALKGDVQIITRHGKDVVAVVKLTDFLNLQNDFRKFLLNVPKTDDLKIERSKIYKRDIEL